MNESDLSELEMEFLETLRTLKREDYDTRAKFIQNLQTGMAKATGLEDFTAMLSSYLKTAN